MLNFRNIIFSQTGDLADTKIAFTSDRDGNDEIYVMNADGSNPTQLTDIISRRSKWSPDGSKIKNR